MKKKIRVGVLFGGKSAEHEVSLRSARNVVEAIDKRKYEVVLIGIDKRGQWLMGPDSGALINKATVTDTAATKNIALAPESAGAISVLENPRDRQRIDVVFPILHGPFGEDGTVQGLLKLAGVPFVGAGVLGSAVGMDKDVMKRLLKEAGLPIGAFLVVRAGERLSFASAKKALGLPLFIKPANLGSSVGVSKVATEAQYDRAVKLAFAYDNKVIVEEYIKGREIECAVLGNDKPVASVPGELKLNHEFYSYEAKYLDEHGMVPEIPARLPKSTIKKIQELAVKTFLVLECAGLARVDFFLRDDGALFINEINTLPGFTSISMYPKLWEASGISYSKLIDKLITLAIERFKKESKLKSSH